MTGAWAAYNREREPSYLFSNFCRGREEQLSVAGGAAGARAEGFTGIRQADQSISQSRKSSVLFCSVLRLVTGHRTASEMEH
jgi:hypothetical protein